MLVAKTKGVGHPALIRLRFFLHKKSGFLIAQLGFEDTHHNDMLEC